MNNVSQAKLNKAANEKYDMDDTYHHHVCNRCGKADCNRVMELGVVKLLSGGDIQGKVDVSNRVRAMWNKDGNGCKVCTMCANALTNHLKNATIAWAKSGANVLSDSTAQEEPLEE